MITQKIEIELTGKTYGDLEDALEEAVSRIRNGNVSGADSNDDGCFFFSSVTEGEEEEDGESED